ncbi:DJ-1/PfpI family protein [Pseudomonas sp. NPDC007930]|uniref:type 1 glutamine amidotransferase domain-containing protein n=1 Tax=Pseudomonas sp. NPDC007930 TaxID=3364417 RepID=UPI0036EE86ED
MNKRILLVSTSQATLGASARATGVWFEELTTPYYHFLDAGFSVELASPNGGEVPIDPHSREEAAPSVQRFLVDPLAMAALGSARPLAQVRAEGYAAVFLPGGHGTMWDLPAHPLLAALLSSAWQLGKVISAVCHGPAGLLSARDSSGQPLVAGRRVSAFSNEEEAAAGLTEAMPFLLETRLRELGARYEGGPAFTPYAVRDGRLVTGQNPMSSERVAQLTLEAIGEG